MYINLYFNFVFQSTLNMEAKKYLDDLSEIKNMMNRSSRFISLSGLSGILAGIYSLVGAFFANNLLNNGNYRSSTYIDAYGQLKIKLIFIAVSVIVLAIITGIILTSIKAKKANEKVWDTTSKRLLINFFIPLITGGVFTFILIQKQIFGLIAPITLIFYGLACVNASKYTLGDVRYLGVLNIIIGLIATQYIGYGLYFWALGFGVLHIIYGGMMYIKHDRK